MQIQSQDIFMGIAGRFVLSLHIFLKFLMVSECLGRFLEWVVSVEVCRGFGIETR